MNHAHESGFNLIEYASAIGLIFYFLLFGFQDLRSMLSARTQSSSPAEGLETVVLPVEGMTCQGCVKKLTRNLEAVPEINSVHVDLESASATVTGNVTTDSVSDAIKACGFKVA